MGVRRTGPSGFTPIICLSRPWQRSWQLKTREDRATQRWTS